MKTFEEALGVSVRSGIDPTMREKSRAELVESQARYSSLIEEARQNETLQRNIVGWAMKCTAGPKSLLDALFTAFVCGLATGIEMEKADPASFARTQGAATDEPGPRKAPINSEESL